MVLFYQKSCIATQASRPFKRNLSRGLTSKILLGTYFDRIPFKVKPSMI
jgi:hypothetical protein